MSNCMWPDANDHPATALLDLTVLDPAARNRAAYATYVLAAGGDAMRDFMAVTKALADENRVRLLLALRGQELCLCQLIELVDLAPSTVSKHMSILKQARLVESRKDGRWMYYRLPGADAPAIVRQAIQWATRSLQSERQVVCDGQRLEEILKLDPHELCESQCEPAAKSGVRRRRVKAASGK